MKIFGWISFEVVCLVSSSISNISAMSGTSVFQIPDNYDYSKSSEENYCCADAPFVGEYQDIRKRLDYTYHRHYSVERQLLQDVLIQLFLKTIIYDRSRNLICEVPLENWIVFTAGPMGSGKGHTIQWLYQQDLFPFDAFVNVDPDAIRSLLPEFTHYIQHNIGTAGALTQKEVGYISEILSYDALKVGKNVLVDGSLRNTYWYLEYFKNLRAEFPIVKIAIIEVSAQQKTVLFRAAKRSLITGRVVPEAVILDSIEKIPISISVLSAHANYVVQFLNEDHEPEPVLAQCVMRDHTCENIMWSLSIQQDDGDTDEMMDEDGYNHHFDSGKYDGEVDNNVDHSKEKQPNDNNKADDFNKTENAKQRTMTIDADKNNVNDSSSNNNRDKIISKTKRKGVKYMYYNQHFNSSHIVDSWKNDFRDVWDMKCELPNISPKTPNNPPSTDSPEVLSFTPQRNSPVNILHISAVSTMDIDSGSRSSANNNHGGYEEFVLNTPSSTFTRATFVATVDPELVDLTTYSDANTPPNQETIDKDGTSWGRRDSKFCDDINLNHSA